MSNELRRWMRLIEDAFHGTPHAGFENFSVDKIGTGEGAAVYGWGLYFATARDVGEYYRDYTKPMNHPGQHFFVNGKLVEDGDRDFLAAVQLAFNMREYFPNDQKGATEWLDRQLGALHWINDHSRVERLVVQLTNKKIEQKAAGRGLYHVELIPPMDHWLDWDIPMIKQTSYVIDRLKHANLYTDEFETEWSESRGKVWTAGPAFVKAIIDKTTFDVTGYAYGVGYQGNENDIKGIIQVHEPWASAQRKAVADAQAAVAFAIPAPRPMLGNELYRGLARELGNDKAASLHLLAIGIPGLRYYDAGSRDSHTGTHNYVVFDDKLVRTRTVDRS